MRRVWVHSPTCIKSSTMRIPCPNCGERGLEEFSYRGDATVTRPTSIEPSSESAWLDYVYLRDNPYGPHWEFWHHISGCRAWFRLKRDTVTHEVLAVALAAEVDGEGHRS